MQWRKDHISYNFDLSKGPIHVEWFRGAVTNLCYNCLDRNVNNMLGDKPCFIWEGNEPCTYLSSLERLLPLGLMFYSFDSLFCCDSIGVVLPFPSHPYTEAEFFVGRIGCEGVAHTCSPCVGSAWPFVVLCCMMCVA